MRMTDFESELLCQLRKSWLGCRRSELQPISIVGSGARLFCYFGKIRLAHHHYELQTSYELTVDVGIHAPGKP
jgi:hypothetical protein